jgi:hypothetical protein
MPSGKPSHQGDSMIEQVKNLIGKSIDDPEIIDFLNGSGIKYPKKPYISNRSSDDSYWLVKKKQGFDLLFSVRVYNEKYIAKQASRKGMFSPVLEQVLWSNNKSNTNFCFGVGFDDNFDTLIEKLGQPTKSSEWIPDGKEDWWYRWYKVLDASRDIQFTVEWWSNIQKIYKIAITIPWVSPLFYFYDPLCYENIETFLAEKGGWKIEKLFFIQWALDRGLLAASDEDASLGMADINKSGAVSYIKKLNRGYLVESDFLREGRFVRLYIKNSTGQDIVYQRDFALHFLHGQNMSGGYLSEEATTELNKIECNQENYQQIAEIIDRRFAEIKKMLPG